MIMNQCGWEREEKKRGAKRPVVCVKNDVCVDPAGLNKKKKTSPSPRAVLIFSAVLCEGTCSFLPSSPSRRQSSSSTMTDRKAVIKNADMSEDMQQDAVDCATQAMEKYNIEKDIAAYIKKVRQDSRDGSEWGSCGLTSLAHDLQNHSLFYSLIYFWSVWRRRLLWSGP